jgi:vacuolar protein sorting-associated protein IST1
LNVELLEILELYSELLLARINLLEHANPKDPSTLDAGLTEAVRSLIYAGPRVDGVKELSTVRGLLLEKVGKEVATEAMEGQQVGQRVLDKLKVEPPAQELVELYLKEIARTYNVDWPPGERERERAAAEAAAEAEEDDDEDGAGGGQLEPPLEAEIPPFTPSTTSNEIEDELEGLEKATPPRSLGPRSPITVNPPKGTSDNVHPRVKLPGPPTLKPGAGTIKTTPKKAVDKGPGPGGKIPDVDELSKRFAALKR